MVIYPYVLGRTHWMLEFLGAVGIVLKIEDGEGSTLGLIFSPYASIVLFRAFLEVSDK